MPYKYSRETDSKLKILAYYQIVGGILGILMVGYGLLQSSLSIDLGLIIYITAFIFFVFSIYVGKVLLDGHTDKGLKLSLINQAMQVIHFSILGYSLHYVAGISISWGIDLSYDVEFDFKFWLSMFEFRWNSNIDVIFLDINILAIYILYQIQKLQNRIERSTEFVG